MNLALLAVVLLEFAGLVALGVILIVSRRKLAAARRELKHRDRDGKPRQRSRKPVGIAPLAVKTVVHTVQTADSILRKGIGGSVVPPILEHAHLGRAGPPEPRTINPSRGAALPLFFVI